MPSPSRILLALLLLGGTSVSSEAQRTDERRLRAIALQIARLDLRRQTASATPATIDSLLSLYADDVVYEHPNAGAVIRGKKTMRRDMVHFIGSIRRVKANSPKVTIGRGVAILETTVRMEVDDDGRWVPVTRHGIRVIEFESNGLVRRNIDYPW